MPDHERELLKIMLKPEAQPVRAACRQIPEPLWPKLKNELDTLEEQGIIEKVDRPTDWIHPIVVVQKKDSSEIRLCVDFKKINEHIVRPVNPQLMPMEVARRILRGMDHFAVFDTLKGYHHIELDEHSKDLTTFVTPMGRYRYNRLPFGLNLAGDYNVTFSC